MRTLPRVIRQIVSLIVLSRYQFLTFLNESSASFNSCTWLRPLLGHDRSSHRISSAWIAWFPVLFYSTIYIGDLHKRSSPIPTNEEDQAVLDAEATRLGSRALFFSALLSLFVNLTLPLFVSEAAGSSGSPRSGPGKYGETWWERICRVPKSMQIHLATLWAVSHFVFAACMAATL